MISLPPEPVPFQKKEKLPLEKDIERAVVAYARCHGFWCRKFLSPNARAAPDRIFGYPGVNFFFIEFKRPGKAQNFPATEHERTQLREHDRIRDVGGLVWVVDTVDEGIRVLDVMRVTAELGNAAP
jgi:hypothetical protein